MKKVYPVIMTQVEGSVLVEVPDLEILTEGKDLNDAMEMARDAIGVTGITMQDEKMGIPDPRPIESIDVSKGAFAEHGKGIVTLVDIDFDKYRRMIDEKMVRRNVTIPNWLNERAEEAHINVSGVLQEALKAKLGFAN